jgi:sterol desaturase/sphingolipid hydroxylase (fatty acid hydroxylase superfamily)
MSASRKAQGTQTARKTNKRALRKLNQLTESSGALRRGTGLVTGVIALSLAILCFLGVLAFHFPTYLTTPELRKSYDVQILRHVLLASMVIAGGLSLRNIIFNRSRWLAAAAFALVTLCALMGGHKVEVDPNFADTKYYIGLDWFILDLLGSTLIFIFIEKLFPLNKKQPVFRAEWQTDFHHFIVNHLIVGFILLATNKLVHDGFGWAINTTLQGWIQSLPFVAEVLLIVLVADLVQYWTHRSYHEVPILWRLHAVHHSAKSMDWLAGSRQHVLELVITRTLVLAPIYVLGFSKGVIDAYIIIVGFQAVFNHANVDVRLGPLRYLIVTPNFHHWHHSQDKEALDRNYAAHFSFIDYLFGTAVNAERKWPDQYGVLGDYVPNGFLKQVAFPFTWKDSPPPPPGQKKTK